MHNRQELIEQELVSSYYKIGGINQDDGSNLPSKQNVSRLIDGLLRLLFPGYFQDIPVQQISYSGLCFSRVRFITAVIRV